MCQISECHHSGAGRSSFSLISWYPIFSLYKPPYVFVYHTIQSSSCPIQIMYSLRDHIYFSQVSITSPVNPMCVASNHTYVCLKVEALHICFVTFRYYNLAHAVNEKIIRQPSMLRAGTLRDYQLVGASFLRLLKLNLI